MDINEAIFNTLFSLYTWIPVWLLFFLTTILPVCMVLGAIGIFFREPRNERFHILVEIGVALVLSRGVIASLIRWIYPHDRPFITLSFDPLFIVDSSSFPSGHATFLFALAMAVLFHNRRMGWILAFFAVVNGISRIVAGVHWPLDIVGGAVIGILGATIVHHSFDHFKVRLSNFTGA